MVNIATRLEAWEKDVHPRKNEAKLCSSYDALLDYVFDDDDKVSVTAMNNRWFDWRRVEEIISSERLKGNHVVNLVSFANLWNYGFNNFDLLFERIEGFVKSEELSDDNFVKLCMWLLYTSTYSSDPYFDEPVRERFIFPASFVEKLYEFLPVNFSKEDPWIAMRFFVAPSLSDEFKKKIWLERKDEIITVFRLASERRVEQGSLIWNNLSSYQTVLLFVFVGKFFDLPGHISIFDEKFQDGLSEFLSEFYPELDCESLPQDWLFELVKNLQVTDESV